MRAMVTTVVSLWLAAGCGGESNPCAEAAAHLKQCAGISVEARPDCNVEAAAEILSMECSELSGRQASGFGDDFFAWLHTPLFPQDDGVPYDQSMHACTLEGPCHKAGETCKSHAMCQHYLRCAGQMLGWGNHFWVMSPWGPPATVTGCEVDQPCPKELAGQYCTQTYDCGPVLVCRSTLLHGRMWLMEPWYN